MKARILILSLVLLAACQPVDTDYDYENTRTGKSDADSVFTLTLQATKTVDTKALNLVDGKTLNQYWKNTDKVKVFHNGVCVGTLNVKPATGNNPKTATLSGSVQIHGLAQGAVLTLLIPREIFDYTGQKGVLTGNNTIEDTYDYGMATVTVGSINGTTVTTTADAQFENQQSIYRFGFGSSGSLVAREFTVLSENGKLVKSATYEGNAWTPAYGPITVKPTVPNPIPASDNFYYVALQNGSTGADTYSFVIVDNNHKLHLATKTVAADKLGNGKFLTSTSIDAPAVTFTPSGIEITQAY
jgi:hypothetical protein